MTRTAFLAALEQLLAPLPEAERKDALSYYEDYLDAAGPENEARAIAELGSPEEVARKILDEQTPAGSSAAPASPARKPHSRWRMVLGGGLAVLVLVCFFFQHSKATPVQPVESTSPASEIPASSAKTAAESASTQPAVPVSTPDGLTFSLSAEMVSDKLSLKLDYGTILFVVDPNVSDITLQFDGFRTRYLTHSNKKDGTAEFSYHIPKYYAPPDVDGAVLTITAPENILHEVDIDLAMGDVDLGTLSVEELDLSYRHSCIPKNHFLVLEAELSLTPAPEQEIRAKMAELREKRVEKQPLEYPSAGSTFKRPEGYFAGKLIMDAGLRGYAVGDAQVSEKHCGFVINRGNATAAEILQLMKDVQERVKKQSGVTLEPEVKMIGEF